MPRFWEYGNEEGKIPDFMDIILVIYTLGTMVSKTTCRINIFLCCYHEYVDDADCDNNLLCTYYIQYDIYVYVYTNIYKRRLFLNTIVNYYIIHPPPKKESSFPWNLSCF